MMAVKVRTIPETIREIVSRIHLHDGSVNGSVVLELIDFLWPHIPLYSFQKFIVIKAFERPEMFLEMSRGAGKSWIVALISIIKKLIWPGRKIIYSGPTYRQSRHPFHYERELLLESPYLMEAVKVSSGEKIGTENTERSEIVFLNGSKSVALPASGVKIHGERGSDIIITEAFEYPQELFTRTVRPMRYGAKQYPGMPKTLIYETTAGWQHHWMYGERGKIIERMRAGSTQSFFVSFDADDLADYGYLKRDDREDIQAGRLIDEDAYLQQNKNVWLTSAGTFYNLALLARTDLRRAEIEFLAKSGPRYVAGLDVAWSERQDAADTSFMVWKISAGQSPELIFVEVWHAPGTKQQTRDVAVLLKQFDISLLIVDAQGAGVDVVTGLKEMGFGEVKTDEPGRRIILRYPHTSPIINEDHNSFKAAVINGAVSFPSQPEMYDFHGNPNPNWTAAKRVYELVAIGLKQFADLKTSETATGWLHFEPPSGKKRDIAMSILYGWHAVRMVTEVRSIPRKPTLILEPVPYDPFGLLGEDIDGKDEKQG